jgi:hypothetical protein
VETIPYCRVGEGEATYGEGTEDHATQTDEDEAVQEPPKRLQRPTHFQSGSQKFIQPLFNTSKAELTIPKGSTTLPLPPYPTAAVLGDGD